MPSEYIPLSVRKRIAARAHFVCEYCLLPDSESFIGYEDDHIISLKHGGSSQESNLSYSCPQCNRNKGTDIASIDWIANQIVRFFNPRIDIWAEHFRLQSGVIEPLSSIGIVTVNIFRFNDPTRVIERNAY